MQHSLLPCAGGGPEQLVLFLVTRPGVAADAAALKAACQAAISGKLNPLFKVGCLRRALISSLCGANVFSIIIISSPQGFCCTSHSSRFASTQRRACLLGAAMQQPHPHPTPHPVSCRWSVSCCGPRCRAPPPTKSCGGCCGTSCSPRRAPSSEPAAVRAWRSGAGCTLCKT